jgi:hypothetical protein
MKKTFLFLLLIPCILQAQRSVPAWKYEQVKMKAYLPSAAATFLAGMSDGLRDASLFYHIKNGGFWDGRTSFNRKYKNGDYRQGAAFPLSTSFLVWTTDGPHLAATMTHEFDAWSMVLLPEDKNKRFGHLLLKTLAITAVRGLGHYMTYDLLIKNQNR